MIAGDSKTRSFALKQMKKSQIVETRQQQHIMSGENDQADFVEGVVDGGVDVNGNDYADADDDDGDDDGC